jgi:hypothetical protein
MIKQRQEPLKIFKEQNGLFCNREDDTYVRPSINTSALIFKLGASLKCHDY